MKEGKKAMGGGKRGKEWKEREGRGEKEKEYNGNGRGRGRDKWG